ncbi:dihydrofolate reductase family protein [Paenibacillus sp. NPDC093718]|uniref:dihydrofolate reductase family protein n=1 Tax=Paenibacillus sp. NPDC093718 TaxID=3390601 RepID=UPI003D053EDC
MHVSLDGYASDSNGGLDWIPYNEDLEQYAVEIVAEVGAPVYGRTTYRMMESYCPTVLDDPNASRHGMESMPSGCSMLRRSSFPDDRQVEWHNTMLISDNIAE